MAYFAYHELREENRRRRMNTNMNVTIRMLTVDTNVT